MATQEVFHSEGVDSTDLRLNSASQGTSWASQAQFTPADLPIASFPYRVIKRAIELGIIFMGFPFLLPLCLLIAFVIFISSRGPVFYRHRRLGQFQEPIYIWKFRTMYQGSDRLLQQYLKNDPAVHHEWSTSQKLRLDPRITPVGRILRSTSLDEIPQLLNVLAGEMSIVGPRPIVDEEKGKYGQYLQIFSSAIPGITGLWQVSGRCDLSYEERVQLDVRYVTDWSLPMEVKILLKTVFVMIRRDGAY